MYIAILGRQPELGLAELERLYSKVHALSDSSALVDTTSIDPERLGGSVKIGTVSAEIGKLQWREVSNKVVHAYTQAWNQHEGKITLGISAYGFNNLSPRDVQKTGIVLKSRMKSQGVNIRLIPNNEAALSSATSHHNKLGLSNNKIELIIVKANDGNVFVSESIGSQNITSYAKRDQNRPKRDAFVGMLPPKLAQIITNLAVGPLTPEKKHVVLDPFCGTGVLLQEAALMGYGVYGTDLADKMVNYSSKNLSWLEDTYRVKLTQRLEQGDAMDHIWRKPISAVACESYLGQPFSAPPSPAKLQEVRGNCNHIISTFLKNIGKQIEPGTQLCVAIPAWKSTSGSFTHLPLASDPEKLGYKRITLQTNPTNQPLLYYREDQIVARELLILEKA